MRAKVTSRDDLWGLAELGGTFQNPEQRGPSLVWGGSFNFTGHELDEDGGVYADQEDESMICQLNGSPVESFDRAMRHPNFGHRRKKNN
ncbi:MAG: hypothetical protein A2Y82_02890 [Candidatus Buchananbacteria bacterium RBG_13_36_9]|uniref:Uncharacterized protein n=1 Tax=Candidatus Buchananbacteria bacterium RBG_13_36_9 TaxID=1797530 RepID=A0A1G1XRP6_9BACT|nr:MAG: hypothetical protein A2Y82_02890 [Candidatus Buchananbacteria bacterium RBG_13_36_9]